MSKPSLLLCPTPPASGFSVSLLCWASFYGELLGRPVPSWDRAVERGSEEKEERGDSGKVAG